MRPLALLISSYLLLGVCPAPAQRISATPPKFTVSPRQKVNFRKIKVNRRKARWITIRNQGGGNINVSWSGHPSDEFSTQYGGTALSSNTRFKLKFWFQPNDSGRFEVPLVFTTDDPQRPEVTILLTGVGFFR